MKQPSAPTFTDEMFGGEQPAKAPSPPPRQDGLLNPGDQIGDWIVDDILGEGGMGAVYRCHNVLSDKIVCAVKILKPHNLGEMRKRFVREVELLASVQHPAVVRVMGGGEDEKRGVLFMAMEYLEGEELKDRLRRGPLPWNDACRMFQMLGDGLLAAHAKGVVHRDIKPQNIVICTDGTAKLLDFGIAVQKGGTQLTREGLVPGTVSYMAPEVFQGEKPDHRADIYALGQVLWEALTGKEAYPEDADTTPGQSVVQMMGKKLSSEPLDPGDEFTPALRDLVKDCTNPEPDDRLPELTNFVVILKSETTGDALKGLAPAPRRKKKASKPKKGGSSSLGLIVAALISVLLVGVAVVVIGALGGFAFIGLIMAQAMFTMSDTGTWQQPSAYEAPAYGGWAMPEQSIPEGFPFEVTDDAKIISGMATESMGMTTYIVTYTTGSDPAKIIADYDKTFKSRGLTTTTATTSDQNGVTHVVSAYSPSGSDGMATASASPNYMGPGYMVSVTWTPTSGGY